MTAETTSIDTVDTHLICSGKGCRAHAQWGLLWNNPKLHTPDRRKVWLACEDHRDHLENFLNLRGFLKKTVAAADLPTHAD